MLRRRALPACLILLYCSGASAVPVADTLSLSCPVCHGSREAPSSMPNPYRLDPGAIASALRDYRDGTRAGTAMPRLAAALSDDEIRRLAAHYGQPGP
ncbi:MAG: c-type cytochrome [Panacagrimonas sp.]